MKNTFVFILTVIGCFGVISCNEETKTGESTRQEMELTEENQQRLIRAIPPPHLTTSLERKNLIRRLERLNKENQISYIYLISYGKIMAFYTVDGKVSSLNSLLTTPQQVVGMPSASGGRTYHVLPSPDLDSSFGKNPEGIFFFTTNDDYVEWSGEFLWSDHPLKLSQPPELIMNITDDSKNSHQSSPSAPVLEQHSVHH